MLLDATLHYAMESHKTAGIGFTTHVSAEDAAGGRLQIVLPFVGVHLPSPREDF